MLNYREDIDGLRALAVVPVVLYHAGWPVLSGGFVGVDVFFVISGFLITSIIARQVEEGRFSLVTFYERRARRILPALAVVVLCSVVAGWFLLIPEDLKDLGKSIRAVAAFFSNSYFARKLDYFSTSAEFVPLLHTWSLAVEEQFYLIFPLLLLFLSRHFTRPVVVRVMAGITILSVAASVLALSSVPAQVFYQLPFRAWELGVGALLALARFPMPPGRGAREGLAALGLVSIVAPMVVYDASTAFPGLAAVPPVLGAALLIHLGRQGPPPTLVGRLLSLRAMVWVGLVSYSLYLWHWPVLVFARFHTGVAHLPAAVAATAVAVSVVGAVLSWRFVERPLRHFRPGKGSRRAVLWGAAATLCGLLLVGVALRASEGAPFRLPEPVLRMAEVARDHNPRQNDCMGRLPEQGLCRIGPQPADGRGYDFLMWGDSHASALMPAVERMARDLGLSGLFAAEHACASVAVGVRWVPENPACTALNDAVLGMLGDREDMPVVILAARWTLYVESTRYGDETGAPIRLTWNGAGEPADTTNAGLMRAGLRATIAAIEGTGRDVLLLGPVPEAGFDVPRRAAQAALRGAVTALSYPRQAFEERATRTLDILGDVAAQAGRTTLLPLHDLLCDETRCRVTGDDGLPSFVDDDHLTAKVAETLVAPHLTGAWLERWGRPQHPRMPPIPTEPADQGSM